MNNKTLGKITLVTVPIALLSCSAWAAATASDTAANYVSSGWNASTTPNLGTGFGAWSVADDNAGPPYSGTYLDSGSPVVTGGYSWGTYANGDSGSGFITLTRAFNAGPSTSSSLYNQTFSFDLSSQGVGPGQGLLSGAVGSAFLVEYNGTGNADQLQYIVDGGALANTGVTFSQLSAGLDISLAVSGALNSLTENYTLTIATLGNTTLFSQTGTFDSLDYNTSQFQYTDANTSQNNYFNNLNITAEVVPEPSSLALFGLSGLSTLMMFRRRK